MAKLGLGVLDAIDIQPALEMIRRLHAEAGKMSRMIELVSRNDLVE